MKIHKYKKFKAFVITKKYIAFIVCLSILVLTLIIASMGEKTDEKRFFENNEMPKYFISLELNDRSVELATVKNIVSWLVGFNFEKPETILYNYSKKYEVIEDNNNLIITYPKEKKTQDEIKEAPQEKKMQVEEISINKGLTLSNATDYPINLNELVKEDLKFKLENNAPEVLIIHTHTTESYTDMDEKYDLSSDRNIDEEKNMVAIGKKLKEILESNGINTIHDKTVHDYPSYNGAYNRSRLTVNKNLNKYPTIKIVLDLHRDGIVREDGTKVKVVSEINNKKTAQCMFVVGTDVELKHDKWRENLLFASKIQKTANEMYPGLMRPINLREERFNQEILTGCLIIEVGSNGNTSEESLRGIECMGNAIAKTLSED